MKVEPYLSFEGRCQEAIDFYQKALGAKVEMIMHFKDSPDKPSSGSFPPELLNKVMHSSLTVGGSRVMATDGHATGKPNFAGISLTLSVSTDAEAEQFFAALSEGGKVSMPLAKTFFSSRFGMVNDRFGVPWIVIAQA
ncbi:MAG TPA: VOC family protein [Tepidisphaeraceae bacterium]